MFEILLPYFILFKMYVLTYKSQYKVIIDALFYLKIGLKKAGIFPFCSNYCSSSC